MATCVRTFGTFANDNAVGSTSWTNPSDAATSNDTRSFNLITTSNGQTNYLKATNSSHSSGTTLNSTDTITQIKFRVERQRSTSGNPSANIRDWKVYPVEGGSVVTTTNFADTATDWGTSDTTIEYTQTTNLPSASTVLASDWGVVFAANNTNSTAGARADVDFIDVEITFTQNTDPVFDSATSMSAYSTAPWTFAVTVNNNSNRYLLVPISIDAQTSSDAATTVSFAGSPMTLLGAKSAANNDRVELWGLAAPTTAGGNVTITLTGNPLNAVACGLVFYNIKQTDSVEGFASATGTSGTTATVDVTTVPDKCLVVDIVNSTDQSLTVGAGQTTRASTANTLFNGTSSEQKTPAGTCTMSWDGITSGETWTIAALALRPTTAPAFGTAAATGTALTGVLREPDIAAGGKTIILTITGDTWVASGATFNAQRQNIINGLDSAQSETNGWDAEVKAKEVVGAVVRTSDTVVTITLTASAAYNIAVQETISCVIPATALTNGYAITPSPATFRVVPTYNVIGHLGGLGIGRQPPPPIPPRNMGDVRAGVVPGHWKDARGK